MGKIQKNKKEEVFTYKYPHPAVTADCVIFGYDYKEKELKTLLIKRKKADKDDENVFENWWALPGGFLKVDEDETIADTAIRELKEETGLKLEKDNLKEVGCFSKRYRDPRERLIHERVITIAHYALVKLRDDVKGDTDAKEAKWFSINEIPDLAFDHTEIKDKALELLRKDIHFEPIGFDLLPDEFTLPQLQHLYESILGVKFDRRNFANKMLRLNILESIEDPERKSTTAITYRFKEQEYIEFKKKKGFHLEF